MVFGPEYGARSFAGHVYYLVVAIKGGAVGRAGRRSAEIRGAATALHHVVRFARGRYVSAGASLSTTTRTSARGPIVAWEGEYDVIIGSAISSGCN